MRLGDKSLSCHNFWDNILCFFFGPKSFVVFALFLFPLLPLSFYFFTGSVIVYLFILMRKRPRVDLIEPNMLLGHQRNWQQQQQQLAWEVNYGLRERVCVCVCRPKKQATIDYVSK